MEMCTKKKLRVSSALSGSILIPSLGKAKLYNHVEGYALLPKGEASGVDWKW